MKARYCRKGALRPAFTLIEILVVITIIMILAGMTIGGLGYVRRKAAEGRTEVLLGSVSQALEQYRADNGVFPEGDGKEDSTEQVYMALYGDGAANADDQVYLDILNPDNAKASLNVSITKPYTIVDAWGESLRYRHSQSGSDSKMMNPDADFDLWSAGADGQTKKWKPETLTDDLKNW